MRHPVPHARGTSIYRLRAFGDSQNRAVWLDTPEARYRPSEASHVIALLAPGERDAPALHKKYPLRMLFVRKAGLFDLEKLSKRDQKVLVDR